MNSESWLLLIVIHAAQLVAVVGSVWLATRFLQRRSRIVWCLWLVVLVKCVTPPLFGAPWSLFSLVQGPWMSRTVEPTVPLAHAIVADAPVPITTPKTERPQATGEILSAVSSNTVYRPARIEHVPKTISSKTLILGTLLTLSSVSVLWTLARYLSCLRAINRGRCPELEAEPQRLLEGLASQVRLKRVPRLFVADVSFGPAVLGVFRPIVLLPKALLEDSDFDVALLRPVLAHELAHIRRGDLWVGMLQAVANCLWWFHPAVRMANRWLSRAAEQCCDEYVVRKFNCSPAEYAKCLLAVMECRQKLKPVPVFPGMTPVEITSQRMERIMTLKNGSRTRDIWKSLAVAIVAAALILPGAASAIPQEEAATGDEPELLQFDARPKSKASDNAETVVSRLTQKVSFAFHSAPLGEVLRLIAKEGQCNIVVDSVAIKAIGVDMNTVVSAKVEDVRCVDALVQILEKVGLEIEVLPEVVKVTTAANLRSVALTARAEETKTRSFDLGAVLKNAAIVGSPSRDEQLAIVQALVQTEVSRRNIRPISKPPEARPPSIRLHGDTLVVTGTDSDFVRVNQRLASIQLIDPRPITHELRVITGEAAAKALAMIDSDKVTLSARSVLESNSVTAPRGLVSESVQSYRPNGICLLSDLELFFVMEAYAKDVRANLIKGQQAAVFSGSPCELLDLVSRPFVVGQEEGQPQVRIISEGLATKLTSTRVSNDEVEVSCELWKSRIGDCVEHTFETQKGPFTVKIPCVETQQVQTKVSMASGQTILISGLRHTETDEPPQPMLVAITTTFDTASKPATVKKVRTSTQVYRVADLVTPIQTSFSNSEPVYAVEVATKSGSVEKIPVVSSLPLIGNLFQRKERTDKQPDVTQVAHEKPAPAVTDWSGPLSHSAPALKKLVQSSVAPEKWGSDCTISFNEQTLSFVVRADEKTHDKLSDLLEELRLSQDRQNTMTICGFRVTSAATLEQLRKAVDFIDGPNGLRWTLLSDRQTSDIDAILQTPEADVRRHIAKITAFDDQSVVWKFPLADKVSAQLNLLVTQRSDRLLRIRCSVGPNGDSQHKAPLQTFISSGNTLLVEVPSAHLTSMKTDETGQAFVVISPTIIDVLDVAEILPPSAETASPEQD